jgi:hypothetical protein
LPLRQRDSHRRCDPNLVGIVGFPRPGPAESAFEVGQPDLKFLVDDFEEDRFAAVEVAQHVGLGQPDASGQFPQADVGDALLGQHFARSGHDRRPARRHLFRPAGALKRHM